MVPLLVSIGFAWSLTFLLVVFQIVLPRPLLAPFEELPATASPEEALVDPAPYLNALIFVVIIGVSGVFVIYAVRRFGLGLRYFILALVGLVSFGVSSLFVVIASALLTILSNSVLPLLITSHYWFFFSAIVTFLVVFSLTRRGELAALLASAYVGSGVGVFLGVTVPFWTAMVLFAAMSAFDVFAVFRGHLRLLGGSVPIHLKGLMVEFRGMDMGLGDLIFYSMLVSFSLTHFGLSSGIGASTGVGAGFAATLFLLKKRKLIPALPLPLSTGLALALALSIL